MLPCMRDLVEPTPLFTHANSWGMRLGPEPGAVVKAVGANSLWIAVELHGHRLKYLPLRHPKNNSALFLPANEDGTLVTQSPLAQSRGATPSFASASPDASDKCVNVT